MLCGEFHRAPLGLHLNNTFVSDIRSPYWSLLTLVRGMAAITAQTVHDDEDIFLGNFQKKKKLNKSGIIIKNYIFIHINECVIFETTDDTKFPSTLFQTNQ